MSQCHDFHCFDQYRRATRHRVEGGQCHDFYPAATDDAGSEDLTPDDLDLIEPVGPRGEPQPA
jgi:hypothetical protein